MTPQHLAFVCTDPFSWSFKKKKKPYEGCRKTFAKILEVVSMQVKQNIPITTYYVMKPMEISPQRTLLLDELHAFLLELSENPLLHEHKIKISILGKWYDLPSKLIDVIKTLIDDTKEYDEYFVNFCINYDGHEEIVDACKMVARRVKLGRIAVEAVNTDSIKDDLYSSYFLPPDVIFIPGDRKRLESFLLWDSVDATLAFVEKEFADLTVKEILKETKRK
ncbi:MAG TPA: undecaprenyl diphosphate synthase family protein [Candidatus Nanoarchaeia archaeon]|nr:undecaprenyl diphosphate synthase family protein [Candidatus Nanoarchaeia archaeon]